MVPKMGTVFYIWQLSYNLTLSASSLAPAPTGKRKSLWMEKCYRATVFWRIRNTLTHCWCKIEIVTGYTPANYHEEIPPTHWKHPKNSRPYRKELLPNICYMILLFKFMKYDHNTADSFSVNMNLPLGMKVLDKRKTRFTQTRKHRKCKHCILTCDMF